MTSQPHNQTLFLREVEGLECLPEVGRHLGFLLLGVFAVAPVDLVRNVQQRVVR